MHFFLMTRRTPISTLFPYTTLFRSKWHFQEVHHDIWDYDDEAAPVLADIKYHGQTRKVLIHAGKTGFLYIYDRTNGKPARPDRKSTRLNSSHMSISYAVFCLKKKNR